VSIVSVSLLAGPPHLGHVVLTNSGTLAKGEPPSPVKGTSSGRSDGKVGFWHWHNTASLAIDDRDRRTPVALAGD